MKTASGRTVTGHAPQGGQASDQASERAPGRHRPPRPDTSHTKTPKRGQTGFESQTRSTGTNLATAPDGTTRTLTDRLSGALRAATIVAGGGWNFPTRGWGFGQRGVRNGQFLPRVARLRV